MQMNLKKYNVCISTVPWCYEALLLRLGLRPFSHFFSLSASFKWRDRIDFLIRGLSAAAGNWGKQRGEKDADMLSANIYLDPERKKGKAEDGSLIKEDLGQRKRLCKSLLISQKHSRLERGREGGFPVSPGVWRRRLCVCAMRVCVCFSSFHDWSLASSRHIIPLFSHSSSLFCSLIELENK